MQVALLIGPWFSDSRAAENSRSGVVEYLACLRQVWTSLKSGHIIPP